MQNVGQSDKRNLDKVNVQLDVVKSSTTHSSASSPAKSETETYSGVPAKYMTDSSESEDDSVSEAEMEEEGAAGADGSKFLHEDPERNVDPEMQARLEALLEAAGIGKLSGEGKHLADPEVLRRLTSSVSCALDEAAAALTRMRTDQPVAPHRHHHQEKQTTCGSTATGTVGSTATTTTEPAPSLAEACSDGDVGTVRKLLTEGRSVHETTEEGESLLSLACSAGYFELAQVLLAMHASVEDRGIKGDCTPLMEAASAGHVDIVRLLVAHQADVNAQSGSGNTPLMYACAGGHEACVQALLGAGANVEDHNENGHTPLMEAASAGHVGVARILLEHGAGINTHSNEFKESALTLACYKGHLDMVRFLLAAGADREHKTDEMHTALMEASMDGHVEVARLLLDSGAQVNMPTDSFESPLTLAACGGHVDLAMLLLERGANIEEVNDEGYTPLMEAAREGHEEMVALLLGQGAAINAQTDETQETALTLACCGGFLEVADFLIKAGADVELGASTPLMEASQEGHLELVRYLLGSGSDVHAQTQTGDTALTYACENGHTDVADLLLRYGADLEHESEGGRTPLMKACRAGHLCTVQFLVGKGADVNRVTANGDHTPLSLACAGGHADVVKFLLACDADPFRKLKDNSTTLIEAAKGGHTAVVQLLLDYPHSVMMSRSGGGNEEGLNAAQAAQLGLSHVPAPGAPHQRALVPAAMTVIPAAATAPVPPAPPTDLPSSFAKAYLDAARKKQQAGGGAGGGPGVPGGVAGPAPAPAGPKHKCARKQRATLPSTDHHLPPPPDIVEEQRADSLSVAQRCESLPETDMLDLVHNTGPPTLATSALHALELQPFCAQGVTTTPLYPTQQPFPPQQPLLAANVNQHQQQELQQQHLEQLAPQHQKKQPLCLEQQSQMLAQQQYAHELQQQRERADTYVQQVSAAGLEARELGAVLAYLQREVPSLVALPPNELRALVLQVMQQKSHEILAQKCGDGEGEGETETEEGEGQARRLLAAAAEEALTAEWPAHADAERARRLHACSLEEVSNGQYQLRPPSPAVEASALALTRPPDERLTEVEEPPEGAPADRPPEAPFYSLPPPTIPYEDAYRTPTFTPPHVPLAQTQAAPQPHGKRDAPNVAPHANTPPPLKKKGRFAPARAARDAAPGYPHAHPPHPAPAAYSAMDVDGETDSNHDTALTLACAGGHEELVELLLSRGADIEHRDKKGFTPLILAATAGHEKIVEILLNHGADIEAQSERTKDTPLSLACSGGRYEVVELVLARGANKEHRNVSDYTPLSLAASGGYVNIIRLLLHHQAEINSRTGSKLGISPLMLAAMNGHTAAVRLLLDCGSDINAQIETNRNTALTLACFQGRHEVVSLLLDRKANVEHRAKTGLTPLMEAASGGYVEVGRVLLDKGADVNAPPVPSSRDTALTIAADKGHTKFVELLLQRRAAVEVKNKKGNSPLWLAANGGHLSVVEMLYAANADIDSQDNRKVSCLMAAFRKGHTKVVKWMVGVVTQFPSDQEMTRYICTISDKELLEKCQECVRAIRAAKETQAARANQNATILLEELDAERCREESKRQAAARRRERKKKKKMEKKEERRKLLEENDKNSVYSEKASGDCSEGGEAEEEVAAAGKEEGDSGIDANSQGSCSSSDVKPPPTQATKSKKKKKEVPVPCSPPVPTAPPNKQPDKIEELKLDMSTPIKPDKKQEKENVAPSEPALPHFPLKKEHQPTSVEKRPEKKDKKSEEDSPKTITLQNVNKFGNNSRKGLVFESTRHNVEKDDTEISDKTKKSHNAHPWEQDGKSTSPKGGCVGGRREDGWKEVVRKSSVQTLSTVEPGCKKVSVASHAISRVIGRAGTNINAIRSATGAHIEVDKQGKGQGERIITIKGSAEATKQAATLIAAMIRDPDADISQLLPRAKLPALPPQPLQPKPPKQALPKECCVQGTSASTATTGTRTAGGTRAASKQHARASLLAPPRLQTQAEKRSGSSSAPTLPTAAKSGALSYTGAIVGARSHTFAAKLTATPPVDAKPRILPPQQVSSSMPLAAIPIPPPPKATPTLHQESPPASAPAPPPVSLAAPPTKSDEVEPKTTPQRPSSHTVQLSPESAGSWSANEEPPSSHASALHVNTAPQQTSSGGAQEYSLFKDLSLCGMWGAGPPSDAQHNNPDPLPMQVDASKAPGYRGGGGGCSPCSRTSSHSSTPPPAYHHPPPEPAPKHAHAIQRPSPPVQPVMPIGPPSSTPQPIGNGVNTMDMSGLGRNVPIYQDNSRNGHNMMVSMSGGVGMNSVGLGYVGVESVSRLNPRAPDFSQQPAMIHHNHNAQLFAGASNAGNLGTLLMSYQQAAPKHPPHANPAHHHHYQSMLERGVLGAGGWGEEEERKPRPIGTERAWKLNATDDWPHQHHPHHAPPDHERYQNVSGVNNMGAGASGVLEGAYGAGGATAAALSLMHALPLHYMPPAQPEHQPHWEHPPHLAGDKQGWSSKWTH